MCVCLLPDDSETDGGRNARVRFIACARIIFTRIQNVCARLDLIYAALIRQYFASNFPALKLYFKGALCNNPPRTLISLSEQRVD